MAEYKNPNQQGGGKQDSRSLLIFSTVFLAILLGMQLFRPKTPATHAPAPAPAKQASSGSAAIAGGASTASLATPPAKSVTAPETPKIAAARETTTTVENELYRITFTNHGGEVTSWILKKYTDYKGKPLDLVNTAAAKQFGYPLSIYTSDPTLRQQMAQALYVPSASGNLAAPAQLTFDYSAGGLVVHKVFHFDNSYVIRAQVTVTRNGEPVEALLSWPAGFGDQREARDYSSDQKIDRSSSGSMESIAPKKVSDGEAHTGPLNWGGVSDLYFAAIFLPDKPESSTFVSLRNTLDVPKDPSDPQSKTAPQPVLGAAVGAADGTTSVRLFAGPQDAERAAHGSGDGDRRQSDRPEPGAAGALRHVFHRRQAALLPAELGARAYRAELGLGDSAVDADYYDGDFPDALRDYEVLHQDAAHSAADELHQGEVQKI